MNQIFLGEPSEYIRNWFIKTFPSWPAYTTLNFVDGTTQTKEIIGAATWQNIGVKSEQFASNNTLKSCQLGKKVTEISGNAFYCCSSLTSINIPNSVTSIGNQAFCQCRSLTSINIPSAVRLIDVAAFVECSSLTAINVNTNNLHYDSRDNCNAIIETSSNTLIYGCGNTIIPNSVTSIGRNAFDGCKSLTSINIPNSVTSIGDCGFYRCSYLISVNIPSSVTSIGEEAFAGCFYLPSVIIPSSVTSIGMYAFGYDSNLTSVIFEGKAMSDITSMANYPWEIVNTSAIIPGIS